MFRKVGGITMVQVSVKLPNKHEQILAKEIILRYRKRVVQAILSDFRQFNKNDLFEAMKDTSLSLKIKREALKLITMIKEKNMER